MVGMFARSKAGHDKTEVYIIVAEDEDYVYLCDGRLRKIDHPKKKNKKHIQPINKVADSIRNRLLAKKQVRDEEIKREIKLLLSKEVADVESRRN